MDLYFDPLFEYWSDSDFYLLRKNVHKPVNHRLNTTTPTVKKDTEI